MKAQVTEKAGQEMLALRVTFTVDVPVMWFAWYVVGRYSEHDYTMGNDRCEFALKFKDEVDNDTKDEFIDGCVDEFRPSESRERELVVGRTVGYLDQSKVLDLFLSRKPFAPEWEFIKKRIEAFPAFYVKTVGAKAKKCAIVKIELLKEVLVVQESLRPVSEVVFSERPKKVKKKK
jgi:hypothetical protein